MVLSLNRRGPKKGTRRKSQGKQDISPEDLTLNSLRTGGNLDGDGTDSSMLGISPHSFEVLVESRRRKIACCLMRGMWRKCSWTMPKTFSSDHPVQCRHSLGEEFA